jgi:hypothetical protein
MKSGGGAGCSTSSHAPLHQAVGSFFGGVKQFAAHAESEARELRTSVEKPPLSGTQGTDAFFNFWLHSVILRASPCVVYALV